MPHIIVKMWPGRSEEFKQEIADKLAAAASEIIKVPLEALSIGIEDVPKERWEEEIVKAEVLAKSATIYRRSSI